MLKININQVPDYIKLGKLSKTNILIVGNPGVGKSQIIESMRNDKTKVTTMTGSSTIEEYVNGIPQVNTNTNCLEYIEQKWFREMTEFANENPDGTQILFLDEFNTADPQVLKTFLTILAERRIPTLNATIPEQVVIVAAMNPNDQNDTERLIRPMASRFMVLEAISTMDSYKNFILGKEQKSPLSGNISEDIIEVTNEQKIALLEQIPEDEWNSYSEVGEKSYHEINPRSFTNFTRALEHTTNRSKLCSMLSQAFLGRNLTWIEDLEDAKKRRAEKVKNGDVFPTSEEMEEMSTDALEKLYEKFSQPGNWGAGGRKCRVELRNLIKDRKSGVKLEPKF